MVGGKYALFTLTIVVQNLVHRLNAYRQSKKITLYLGLCKMENEILKEAKNAEKSHF